MLNILINAYAISPTWGSEPGMGWNWVRNLANHCNLFIITEGEWKKEIEETVALHPYKDNLHFYFLPLPDNVRKMCWNQGDWRFYHYYKKWQKRALIKAIEICNEVDIDIVHQLNMVSFREPGYLWRLGKPFVWGPIGGLGETPKAYISGVSFKTRLMLWIKDIISTEQLKYSHRIGNAFNQADALISAVPMAQEKIMKYKHRDTLLIPETGCYDLNTVICDKRHRKDFHILWVGRFLFTKRLDIAMRTIAEVKELPNLHFHILGSGSESEVERYHQLGKKLGIDGVCEWHGNVENKMVHQMMRDADLFFFTSVREATSTVIPEAINNCLPIVCFDTCGFGPLVTEKIGRKVALSTPEQSVFDFAKQIRDLYSDKEILYEMSNNCKEALKSLLWDVKAKMVFDIYEKVRQKK